MVKVENSLSGTGKLSVICCSTMSEGYVIPSKAKAIKELTKRWNKRK